MHTPAEELGCGRTSESSTSSASVEPRAMAAELDEHPQTAGCGLREHTFATSELSAQLAAARAAIVAELEDEEHRGSVPYHRQVDTSMYTAEAKQKRLALKTHPEVGSGFCSHRGSAEQCNADRIACE